MSFVVPTTKVHNDIQPGLALVPADRPSFRDIVVPGTSCNCKSTSRIFGKPYGAWLPTKTPWFPSCRCRSLICLFNHIFYNAKVPFLHESSLAWSWPENQIQRGCLHTACWTFNPSHRSGSKSPIRCRLWQSRMLLRFSTDDHHDLYRCSCEQQCSSENKEQQKSAWTTKTRFAVN